MARISDRSPRIPPGPAAALLLAVAAAPAAPAPADPPAATIRMAAGNDDTRPDASRGPVLAPLRRQVRRFDFEEAETALVEFPLNFKRNIAQDLGFTAFGRLALTDDAATSGRWSFRFDLDGSSLSAAIPTGILPVLPLADYEVTVQVRTSGLARAGARLVAQLHDADGRLTSLDEQESDADDLGLMGDDDDYESTAFTSAIDEDMVDSADDFSLDLGDDAAMDVDLDVEPAKTDTFLPGDFDDPEELTASESDIEDVGFDDLDDLMLPDDVDEVGTKLDLARAFIDMGDTEGARSSLDEVMAEGNEEQKKEATLIIKHL